MAAGANCPACGGPIEFAIGSSVVVICEFCNSAVARTDRDLRSLGKVADLVDTQSPLAVGAEGAYEGREFVLTGRAQLRHEAGGVWDEWYASFGGRRWGWLAEAQGRFYMTFPQRLAGEPPPPAFDSLGPGEAVAIPGARERFVVAETGVATAASAEGEIPYELRPGEQYRYADLEGENAAFVTIDYGERPPVVYRGREVTLEELGVRGGAGARPGRRVGVERLTCPRCGGPMELRAPSHALRVTCPSCNSLLDVTRGNLVFLDALARGPQPVVPLGAEGTLGGARYVVAGFMTRACVVEGIRYPWEEYLLYSAERGFRWLVRSDDHWTFVAPVSAGAVYDAESTVTFGGRTFKRFQDVTARVESVAGEFYWRVEVGEAVRAADYVCPPEMVSRESGGSEVVWSLGTYLPREEVAKAFRLERPLPEPKGVAPAQPNPVASPLAAWVALVAAAVVLFVALQVVLPRRQVVAGAFAFPALESKEASQTLFAEPLDVGRLGNLRVRVRAPVDNAWFYVEGDLINEETGLVQNFSVPVEYYHGVDGGESWSEGSTEAETFLSSLPAGRYTMRLEAQWGDERPTPLWQKPVTASVEVTQGVPRLWHFAAVVLLLTAPAAVQLVRRRNFEVRRWSESMFNPYESSDD